MSTAILNELRMAIGYKKQSALQTALVAADTWSLRQSNRDIGQPMPNSESDKDDLGKGTPWATQLFKSHLDSGSPWNYFLTSENAAMVAAFGLGNVVKTAAGSGFKYSCTPLDPVADGIDMPSTTAVWAIRQGASSVFDYGLIGICCEEFGFSLNSGPGRQNSQMTSRWVGCGMYANPSGISIPTIATEHSLNAGNTSVLTVLGHDYIANKNFVKADFQYKNNIRVDSGFYPGSGSQNGFNLRGRMRRGNPEAKFTATVEFGHGSTEFDDFIAQTEGTIVITVNGVQIGAGPETHQLKITLQRVIFHMAKVSENDQIVTVDLECDILEHASNGVLKIEVTNEKDLIFTTAT